MATVNGFEICKFTICDEKRVQYTTSSRHPTFYDQLEAFYVDEHVGEILVNFPNFSVILTVKIVDSVHVKCKAKI